MNSIKIKITHIMVLLTAMLAADSILNAAHLYASNSDRLIRPTNYSQNYAQESDVLNQTGERNQDPFEKLAERYEVLMRKNKDMKKEYQILEQEKEQLNTELEKIIKKNRPKKRNSRSLMAAKRFREKKQQFDAKYADFLRRKEAVDKELNELIEILNQLREIQPSS